MAGSTTGGSPELDRIQPEDLISLAEALRDLGVTEFSWGSAHVKFQDKLAMVKLQPETKTREDTQIEKPADQTSFYEDRRLWGGGKPPLFPGQTHKDG